MIEVSPTETHFIITETFAPETLPKTPSCLSRGGKTQKLWLSKKLKEAQPSTLVTRPYKGKSSPLSALQGIVGLVETPRRRVGVEQAAEGRLLCAKAMLGRVWVIQEMVLREWCFQAGHLTGQKYMTAILKTTATKWSLWLFAQKCELEEVWVFLRKTGQQSLLCQETAFKGIPKLQLPALSVFHNQEGKVRLLLISKFILWILSGRFLFWIPFIHMGIHAYPQELWGASV